MMSFSPVSTWPTLASDSQKASILSILEELERAFCSTRKEINPSLSTGSAGTALFLGYLTKLHNRQTVADHALNLLSQSVERIEETFGTSLFTGYTGIAWTVDHLLQFLGTDEFGQLQEEDANQAVDEVLLDLLSTTQWNYDYDLVSGLSGHAVYALERLSRPRARLILAKILSHFEALSVPCAVGLSWPTHPRLLPQWQRKLAPNGYFNLGLAHGVPGVLTILAAMEKAGKHHSEIDPQQARTLLEGGMAWLFSQFHGPEGGSYLAGWCPVDREVALPQGTRVGWCYGDLGASLAILNVARMTGNREWEERAISMATLAASRSLENSGIYDVSLCHGSAGNMLIFMRLFQITRNPIFQHAAQLYLDHLITTRTLGGPFAGYTTYAPETDGEAKAGDASSSYKPDSSVLMGATGAGLALLAALGIEPKWDRCMLLSMADLS